MYGSFPDALRAGGLRGTVCRTDRWRDADEQYYTGGELESLRPGTVENAKVFPDVQDFLIRYVHKEI